MSTTQVNHQFRFVTPFIPSEDKKERVKWLWEHLATQEEQFDDISRGKHEALLYKMFKPGSELFEVGDSGICLLEDIVPKVGCTIHHAIWDKERNPRELVAAAKEIINYAFTQYELNRISTGFPNFNEYGKRMSVLMGFRFEGELRKAFLYHGTFYNFSIYGLLRSEFYKQRGVS